MHAGTLCPGRSSRPTTAAHPNLDGGPPCGSLAARRVRPCDPCSLEAQARQVAATDQDRDRQITKITGATARRNRKPGVSVNQAGNGADRPQRSPRRTRATAEHGRALFVPSGDRAPWCRTPVAHADRKRDVREVAVRGSFRSVRVAEGDARMIKRRYGVATASARGPAFKRGPVIGTRSRHEITAGPAR